MATNAESPAKLNYTNPTIGSIRQWTKRAMFGDGVQPKVVWFGLARGSRFMIDPAVKTQRILGLDEAELSAAFRQALMGAAAFIDIGASDGYYPVIALRLNRAVHVVGCEMLGFMEARARENCKLNGIEDRRLEWINRAIGGSAGQMTLDELAAARPGPMAVKIDVEGHEISVLESGPRLLARGDVRFIVEVHSQQLETGCLELFRKSGYHAQVIKNAWWRCLVHEYRPSAHCRWVEAHK